MSNRIYLLVLFLLSFAAPSLIGQEQTTPKSIYQYFYQLEEAIPTIKVKTDLKQLIKKKDKEEYQAAHFTFLANSGDTLEMKAKIRSRGNVRKEVCYYPPIKVKFKKKDLAAMGLDTLNKFKMVIQCNRGKSGQQYLFKEHLIYKLYEAIGDVYYKARPIKMEFDQAGKEDQILYGFLLEEEEEFKVRYAGDLIEAGRLRTRMIQRSAYLKMCFFQYMVLNTDWSDINMHNLEYMRPGGNDLFVPVPYDFDYAGLVETGYAVPHESLPIDDVKKPHFRGRDVEEDEALQTAKWFLSKKEELEKIVADYPHLDEKEKSFFRGRLKEFFSVLESKKRVVYNFVDP